MDSHSHVCLGKGRERAEKHTRWVIWFCGMMMVLEIVGGLLFGSISLAADGLHMTTHTAVLLLAALAYRYARRHAAGARFSFGTGKLAGIIGASLIASWAYNLMRDAGGILIDMNPGQHLTERLRREIETDSDRLTDLRIWRLGPGHLVAGFSVATGRGRRPEVYHQRLRHFSMLSDVTVEVNSL